MSFKCPKCEKEFSYGIKIYHKCKENEYYSGVIFEENKKKYPWNCGTT